MASEQVQGLSGKLGTIYQYATTEKLDHAVNEIFLTLKRELSPNDQTRNIIKEILLKAEEKLDYGVIEL